MSIVENPFGKTKKGVPVSEYTITSPGGASMGLLSYGATLRSLRLPNSNGGFTDLVLGYDSIEEYEQNDGFFGATIGRNANRISDARFELNGREYLLHANNGKNQLHSGQQGLHAQVWSADPVENGLRFSILSPDGQEGFPGNLQISVTFKLTEENALEISYTAVGDADTVCNLTNHSYFNLNGGGTVLNHSLELSARSFTEHRSDGIPTGRILSVVDTPMDFTSPKNIGADIASDFSQISIFNGFDHNYVLPCGYEMQKAAVLIGDQSGIVMTLFTDCPGVQLYTSNTTCARQGKAGAIHEPYCAVCLETQYFPDAINCQTFPSPILRAGERYHSLTKYVFSQS